MIRKNRMCAGWQIVSGLSILALCGVFYDAQAQDPADEKELAGKIVGPDDRDNGCVKCHTREVKAWKKTAHFRLYNKVDEDAKFIKQSDRILGNLGLGDSMLLEPLCRQCHFTSVIDDGDIWPEWGVSCESCHNPAREWNPVHNTDTQNRLVEWGKPGPDRKARLERAREKEMIHSDMTYELALNCFGCHAVADQALVNDGKHNTASDFDLVAWSQGDVRHNFASSAGAPSNPTNKPATPEEKRRLYVVGALVDLEVSLRKLARVKDPGGEYQQKGIEHANAARHKVAMILEKITIVRVKSEVDKLPAALENSTEELANRLGAAIKELADTTCWTDMEIDDLLPEESTYKGTATDG